MKAFSSATKSKENMNVKRYEDRVENMEICIICSASLTSGKYSTHVRNPFTNKRLIFRVFELTKIDYESEVWLCEECFNALVEIDNMEHVLMKKLDQTKEKSFDSGGDGRSEYQEQNEKEECMAFAKRDFSETTLQNKANGTNLQTVHQSTDQDEVNLNAALTPEVVIKTYFPRKNSKVAEKQKPLDFVNVKAMKNHRNNEDELNNNGHDHKFSISYEHETKEASSREMCTNLGKGDKGHANEMQSNNSVIKTENLSDSEGSMKVPKKKKIYKKTNTGERHRKKIYKESHTGEGHVNPKVCQHCGAWFHNSHRAKQHICAMEVLDPDSLIGKTEAKFLDHSNQAWAVGA